MLDSLSRERACATLVIIGSSVASRPRAEGSALLLAPCYFERRYARGEPHRARGEPSDDVAEEVEAQVQPAVAHSSDERARPADRQRAPPP